MAGQTKVLLPSMEQPYKPSILIVLQPNVTVSNPQNNTILWLIELQSKAFS